MFDDLRDLAAQPDDDEEKETSDEDFLAAFGADAVPTFTEEDPAPALAAPSFGADPFFGGDAGSTSTPAIALGDDRLILGMTAPQRAILSVFLFLDVAVLGCVFLLALERIVI